MEALNRVQDVIVNDLSRMVKENSCLSYLPGMYVGTYVHTLSLPSFLTRHEVIFTLFSSSAGNTNERHKKEKKVHIGPCYQLRRRLELCSRVRAMLHPSTPGSRTQDPGLGGRSGRGAGGYPLQLPTTP